MNSLFWHYLVPKCETISMSTRMILWIKSKICKLLHLKYREDYAESESQVSTISEIKDLAVPEIKNIAAPETKPKKKKIIVKTKKVGVKRKAKIKKKVKKSKIAKLQEITSVTKS